MNSGEIDTDPLPIEALQPGPAPCGTRQLVATSPQLVVTDAVDPFVEPARTDEPPPQPHLQRRRGLGHEHLRLQPQRSNVIVRGASGVTVTLVGAPGWQLLPQPDRPNELQTGWYTPRPATAADVFRRPRARGEHRTARTSMPLKGPSYLLPTHRNRSGSVQGFIAQPWDLLRDPSIPRSRCVVEE